MSTTCALAVPAAHRAPAPRFAPCRRAGRRWNVSARRRRRGHRVSMAPPTASTPRGRHRAAKRRRDRTARNIHQTRGALKFDPDASYTIDMVARTICRAARPRRRTVPAGGSVCGNGDEASLASSMLNNCAPGMWPSRKSRRGSRFIDERYHDASRTRTRGSLQVFAAARRRIRSLRSAMRGKLVPSHCQPARLRFDRMIRVAAHARLR